MKLLTFRYSATLGGFDDSALAQFIRDKEVVAFREHFYCVNEVPHLTCVLTYQDAVVPREMLDAARQAGERGQASNGHTNGAWRRDGRPDPAAGLSESDRVLFNTLREWRSKQAREEGAPPYVLFTNRQLLALVAKRPDSPTALGNVEGIGPAKVERYGQALLALLSGTGAATP